MFHMDLRLTGSDAVFDLAALKEAVVGLASAKAKAGEAQAAASPGTGKLQHKEKQKPKKTKPAEQIRFPNQVTGSKATTTRRTRGPGKQKPKGQ